MIGSVIGVFAACLVLFKVSPDPFHGVTILVVALCCPLLKSRFLFSLA